MAALLISSMPSKRIGRRRSFCLVTCRHNGRAECWRHEYTSDLIDLLNVLTLLVEMESEQARLLERVCSGKLISETDLRDAGFTGKSLTLPAAANRAKDERQQEMF
jgi:hypothetical protein